MTYGCPCAFVADEIVYEQADFPQSLCTGFGGAVPCLWPQWDQEKQFIRLAWIGLVKDGRDQRGILHEGLVQERFQQANSRLPASIDKIM
jgi:hypothetical protein